MTCHNCNSICKKFGKFSSKKIQRHRCKQCRKTFSEQQEKPLDDMRIPMDKAVMALQLLLEGCAVASVERVIRLHKRTILSLLVLAGNLCEKLMEKMIKDIPVRDDALPKPREVAVTYGLLDVHHNRLYDRVPQDRLLPLLHGEAESFLTMWNEAGLA